mgnify:CR=1 FL=1
MGSSDGSVLGVEKILDNGDPSQRWNLVITGDGYTRTLEVLDVINSRLNFSFGTWQHGNAVKVEEDFKSLGFSHHFFFGWRWRDDGSIG